MRKRKILAKARTGNQTPLWRINLIIILVFALVGGILARFFLIQIPKSGFYHDLAQNQQQILEKLIPQRGDIFIKDRYSPSLLAANQTNAEEKNSELNFNLENFDKTPAGYFPVAINRTYQMVYAVPREISGNNEADRVAGELAVVLEKSKDEIKEKILKEDDPYEPLARKLSEEQAEKIKNLNIKGIYLAPETWRFYPAENFLSHVLGFVGALDGERHGQYGLEQYYQEELEGKPGIIEAVKDAIGRWIFSSDYNLEPADNGADLVLTIDQNIQFMAEKELREVVEKWGAESGTAIIMEPRTGKILAMANLPDFNPNEYSKVEDINVFLNPAIGKLYEPGSVFKPITMAVGLDLGKIQPETTYTDKGILQIGGYTITNAAEKSYGTCTMTKVLEKSINTGAIFAQRAVGNDSFREYVEKFGFGEATGIDLGGEIAGNINNFKKGSPEINFATAAFGQGVAVTPMELVAALGAVANDGKMMKPYLVEKMIYPDGREEIINPIEKKQVISPEAAHKLTSMLVSTVRNGYDKIKIKGYFVAGKTGTAQMPNEGSRGYSDEFIHTFVGYAPAFDPKFIILLKMDKPRGIRFASDSLSPPFANLTKYLLNYYEIPPEE